VADVLRLWLENANPRTHDAADNVLGLPLRADRGAFAAAKALTALAADGEEGLVDVAMAWHWPPRSTA
jgi:hypothetical protein